MKRILFIFIIYINISSLHSQNIHPNFNIDNQKLESIYNSISIEAKEAIELSKYTFLNDIEKILDAPEMQLELVDKTHRLGSDYIPDEMINLTDYNLHTRYKTMLFVRSAIEDFVDMDNDAKNDGIDLFIASTYRSYEFQDQIFTNMKNYHGEEKAATIVAYPGASQHQLGSAVDFGSITPSYANTLAGKWLLENAWKYGFTLSYPKGMEDITSYVWEPWHYRHIGIDAAVIQRNYFQDSQQLFLTFWHDYQLFFKENHIQ